MSSSYGHADEIAGMEQEPDGPTCAQAHPLLEDVGCQRLKGHPGKHGAYVNEPSVEATVEWGDDTENAG